MHTSAGASSPAAAGDASNPGGWTGTSRDVASLREWLDANGVDANAFGVNGAKSLADLAIEVERGETTLALDDVTNAPRRDVRVLRLLVTDEAKRPGQVLVEARQEWESGRVRYRNTPLSEKLLGNEDWRDAVRRAVDEELGGAIDGLSPAQLSDRLPGLERAVYEGLRLTAHTIGAIRKVVAPGGWAFRTSSGREYRVPEGTFVAASHIAPHFDPEAFGRPDAFDPDRFAAEAGGRPGEYVLTTFSNGLHRCPGQRLAVASIAVALTTILGQYSLELPSPLPPLCFERATLAQRKGPVLVRYKLRPAPPCP